MKTNISNKKKWNNVSFFHHNHNSSLSLRYFSYLSSTEYAEQTRLQYEMKRFEIKLIDKEQSERENHEIDFWTN